MRNGSKGSPSMTAFLTKRHCRWSSRRRQVRRSVLFASEFTFHPPLEGNEKAAPAVGIEVDATVSRFKVGGWIKGAVAEEVERHSVGDWSPERLNDIEGQGRARIVGLVIEANCRIHADCVEMRLGLGGKQRVGIGKHGIGRIVGRPAAAPLEGNAVRKKAAIALEVASCRRAFVSSQGIEGLSLPATLREVTEGKQVSGNLHIRSVRRQSLKNPAAVEDLRLDPADGQGKSEIGFLAAPVMSQPGDAVWRRRKADSKNTSVRRREDDRDVPPHELRKGGGRNLHRFMDDKLLDFDERYVARSRADPSHSAVASRYEAAR